MLSRYDLAVGVNKWVKASTAALLSATCFVASQPRVTSAWTSTSPQKNSVSVFYGSTHDEGRAVVVDSLGNIYTTGTFGVSTDFNPTPDIAILMSAGLGDVFVSKLDASGNFVWAKSFGGPNQEDGNAVGVDTAGNVYTIGTFEGTTDFDPGAGTANLTSAGSTDVFVSKLDSSGNYVWAKKFGGTSNESGNSVAIDTAGNVYTIGTFEGTTDFDPGAGTANLTSAGSTDVFVSKLDSSGNYVWAKKFGGTSAYDNGRSVAVDSVGNVYTTGYFDDAVDFDPGPDIANLYSNGSIDVFVSKLDSSGNYLWAKQFGGSQEAGGSSVAVDLAGNVYASGDFRQSVDFDPGPDIAYLHSTGVTDLFVAKLDSSGNYVWAKKFGGTSVDQGNSVAVDSVGNVYTTGFYLLTADFDPGPGVANLTTAGLDAFVSKLDSSGSYVWARSFGSRQGAVGKSVAVDMSGNVYTAGYFSGTVDFDPGPGTATLSSIALMADVFILKLDGVYGSSSLMPGSPTNVTASSAMPEQSTVSWTAPIFNGGTSIISYTVTSSPGGRTCVWTSGPLSCIVTGLSNGVSYTFSVTATNSDGTGAASSASNSATPGTTSSEPRNVSASNGAFESSIVSWTAPISNGGTSITGYTVTSSPGGRTCVWTSGPLSCIVTGLSNGVSYTFSVTATNASGTGVASSASNSATPSGRQSITFATVGNRLLVEERLTLSAVATSSRAVAFTSATPSVCTVSGSTVTMLMVGDCTINANQSGGFGWDSAPQVSRTFTILPSPPSGEPGVSISNGASFSKSKNVTLNLIWPEYAVSVRISNDGGFAASKTITKDLAATIDWELDDSVRGIYAKVVYVRFNGAVDTTKTYTDDIILDAIAPIIESSTASISKSYVDLLLKASDDITGMDKVEIRNGTKLVMRDYANKMAIPSGDLSLDMSSSVLQKSATKSLEIRVSDNAGNWTNWLTVPVTGIVVASSAKAPVVTLKKTASTKSIAVFANMKVLSTSKVSLKVVSSSMKYCKVSGTTLKGLKAGSCKVTVTVTPKKGRATSKTVTLKVTK